MSKQKFRKVMAANRGEIAIRIFRACTELGIGTVALYSEEDKLSLHRYKADEAYLIGKGKSPIDAYLGIDEIIALALKADVDAIHPGYGFLAENAEFAEKCEANGIAFIGPTADMQRALGDKVAARKVALAAGVATVPGTEDPIEKEEDALRFAKEHGYPIIIKAAAGGGGRGMRVAHNKKDLLEGLVAAGSEAKAAFGNPAVFLERYLANPKHIEVQVLGDNYGNLVHFYERDCSIQRRHQKVVEFAPSLSLTQKTREELCDAALKIAGQVKYRNAGTVEFLLDQEGNWYFIEMNPRIQVEHTVTEMITGRNLVQNQILIACGHRLSDPEINIPSTRRSTSPPSPPSTCAATPSSAVSPPRTRPTTLPRTSAPSPPTVRRPAAASAWTRATPSPAPRSPRTTIRSWSRSAPGASPSRTRPTS